MAKVQKAGKLCDRLLHSAPKRLGLRLTLDVDVLFPSLSTLASSQLAERLPTDVTMTLQSLFYDDEALATVHAEETVSKSPLYALI